MMTRRTWMLVLVLIALSAPVWGQRIRLRTRPATTSGTVVTDSSTLSWSLADLTDLYGFTIDIDGTSDVDVFIPGQAGAAGSQAVLGGGGITFTIPVTALSLTNGAHTLTICSYNTGGTLSASCPQIQVTKQ